MLKGSCNVTEKTHIKSLSHSGFWASPKTLPSLNRRRKVSFSCSKLPDLSVSVSTTANKNNNPTLADRLRLGSLTEDGLSYKESFIVRCYEVGINKTATVETIANLLQEVGCNHAQSVGFSTDGFATTPTMRKLHLIWVTARMHIEIYRYPAWSDVVEIETWCQAEGKIGTRRDFILKDYANGEVIGRATSKWVMMNMDTRKLERVSQQIAEEYLIYCPKTLRLAFPEENNRSVRKIPKLEDLCQHSKLGLVVKIVQQLEHFYAYGLQTSLFSCVLNMVTMLWQPRRADLDMNQHVNNVTYIGWVLESMPQEIIDTHELRSITLDYRRECQHDDVVDSLTSPEMTEADCVPLPKSINGTRNEDDVCLQFLHLLRLSADGSEINRGRTEWRRKSQR